jgi:hypothetical protein
VLGLSRRPRNAHHEVRRSAPSRQLEGGSRTFPTSFKPLQPQARPKVARAGSRRPTRTGPFSGLSGFASRGSSDIKPKIEGPDRPLASTAGAPAVLPGQLLDEMRLLAERSGRLAPVLLGHALLHQRLDAVSVAHVGVQWELPGAMARRDQRFAL